MLNLSPQIIILTNLEEDHLDYYRDLNNIITTFQQYVDKLNPDDLLILNNDDDNLKKLKTHSRVLTYGVTQSADIMATNIETGPGYQQFDLISDKFKIKITLIIKVPGLFNIYNFLAAIAGALALGASVESINKVARSFTGIWRRFEVNDLKIVRSSSRADPRSPKGMSRRNLKLEIVSDYAHHPTAVKDTIKAAQEFFPGRRVVAVFQPHHHNRTKRLFNELVDSFQGADLVIISEIYDVVGREESDDQNISSLDLVQAIKAKHSAESAEASISLIPNIKKTLGYKICDFLRNGWRRRTKYPQQEIFYTPDLSQTKQKLLSLAQPNDVVLIMGAGDIYTLFD